MNWVLILQNNKIDGLRGESMNVKEFDVFMIVFVAAFLLLAFCLSMGDGSSDYINANRYSNCIDKLSDNEKLSFDEMKEVCSQYLK